MAEACYFNFSINFAATADDLKAQVLELERGVSELRGMLLEATGKVSTLEASKQRQQQQMLDELDQREVLLEELREELAKVNTLLDASANTGQRTKESW